MIGSMPASATTYTWTGDAAGGGLWSDPQNWNPTNGVPGPGDTANIGGVHVVNVDSAVTVANVTLESGITLNGDGSLTVSGTLVSLASSLEPSGGVTVNGAMNIQPAASSVTVSTVGSTLTINGTCQIAANAALCFYSNASVVNNGTFTVADNGSISELTGISGVQFINNGQFVGGNASCEISSSLFSNAPSGKVQINADAIFQFTGAFANSGILNVGADGLASIGANLALYNGASFTGSGLTSMSGPCTLSGKVTVSGNLQMASSSLTLNGTLEITGGGNFNWVGGTLQGQGTNVTGMIQVDDSGTMLLNQVNAMTLNNCVLTNNGYLNWTNGGTIKMGYNAQIINSEYFDIYGDGSLQPSPGSTSASIYNEMSGTIIKETGSTNVPTLINVPCYGPFGLVRVQQGKLLFNAGGDIGNWTVYPANAFIELGNGNYNADPGSFAGSSASGAFSMGSQANINIPFGSSLSLNGNCAFQQAGGTIFGNGILNLGPQATFTWNGGTIALTNSSPILIPKGGTLNLSGANQGLTLLGSGVQNNGTINWVNDNSAGGVFFGDNTYIDNWGTFNMQCAANFNNSAVTVNPVLINESPGSITKSASTGTSYIGFKTLNYGPIIVQSGTLSFHVFFDTGARFPNSNAGLPASITLQGGNVAFDGSTTFYGIIQGSGDIMVQSGGGNLNLEGTLQANDLSITGNPVNDGTVKAGDAPGLIPLSNNYTQTTNGTLIIPIRGTNIANMDFGRITGWGSAVLAGTLVAQITEGYAPPVGAAFPFLANFGGRSGTFNNVVLPPGMTINYTSGGATLVVTGAVPVQMISPLVTNGQFQFGFNTISNRSYTVQSCDNLATGTWTFLTNFIANGAYWQPPPLAPLVAQRYYRVSNP